MTPPLLRRLAILLLLSLALVAGAAADPFEVATYADLCKVGTGTDGWTLDADYIQTADIQCPAGSNFPRIGQNPGTPFTGTYDGNGYEIRDLQMSYGDFHTGMFIVLGSTGTLQNITLVNVDASCTTSRFGALAGASSGTISGCAVSGTLTGTTYTGGLVGVMEGGTVSDCQSSCTITSDDQSGGLIGYMTNGTVTSCEASGSISPPGSSSYSLGGLIGRLDAGGVLHSTSSCRVIGWDNCGGLIGYMSGGTVTNCHASGSVSSENHDGFALGGLVGSISDGTIVDSFASGDVAAGDGSHLGGLIGRGGDSSLTRCYATGSVSAGTRSIFVGGLVGKSALTIYDSYADVNVSGGDCIGGLIGDMDRGRVENCSASGTVFGTYNDGYPAGGLIGGLTTGTVTRSYSTGNVSTGWYVGGVVGTQRSESVIQDCYATGDVSAISSTYPPMAGGLVGACAGTISSCYSIGSVLAPDAPAEYADYAGGLVGYVDGGVVNSSYWNLESSGYTTSAAGTGKTTADLQTIATFAGWNIATPAAYTDEVWFIVEGEAYPRLAWEGLPATPPVAAFSAAPTSGTAPLTVQFTDASTNAPTARSWSFGDGTTSTAQSPSHTYSTAGTYTVALTVTNAGGSDTETKTGYITVSAPPPTAPPTAANSPAFPYSQQRKETLSFLLMCWGGLAFVGVFCVVIFLLMNGAQRGSGGI